MKESLQSFEDLTLTVQGKMAEIFENDKVFVKGILTKTTKDCLWFYMERISDLDVKDITYGPENGETVDTIVTFDSTVDFDKIQESFEKRPTLEGKDMSIEAVPFCKTILVKNLPASATHDSVLFKFENKRAGGGDVEAVDLDLEKKIATIEFKDPNVIDEVLSREQTLDQTILSVERYYPILNSVADFTKKETSDPPRLKVPTPKPRKSKGTAFTTEVDRDLYDYLQDNHPAELSLALKDPQPNIELQEESVQFTFSSQDAKEHFLTNMKSYRCEIMPINLVLVDHGLREEIQEIISVFKVTKSVSFIQRYSEGFIKLVGRDVSTFDRATNEVKKCIARVEEKSDKRDDVIEILPDQLKLLQRSADFQRLKNAFKKDGCEIQLDDTTGRITVKGSQAQIQKLRSATQEIVGRFGERVLNESKFSFLGTPKGLSHVRTLFPTENSSVEIVVNDQGNVILYGLNRINVQQAYDTIKNAVDELKLPSSLDAKSQDAFLKELETSIPMTLQTDGGQPRIICFKSQIANLRNKLDDFLERKKTAEVQVPLNEVILRYLSLHGQTLLEGLRMSSPGLNIDQGSDGFIVSGERLLVSNCCISIREFTTGLKLENINYGTPEIAASIKGRATMAVIQSIERKHRCAIVVTTTENTDRRCSFREPRTSPARNVHSLKRTMQCRYTSPNRKIIEIHQGDILSHRVDYLVNSANDELKHSGGLAKAIVEKGGRKIQEDSSRFLQDRKKDRLLPGNVVTTDGGSLMCNKILHVVVPKYSSTRSNEEDEEGRVGMYLKHCCTNVLKNATDGQTIAIPALGTGVYAVPYDISAKSLIEAATEFLHENPNHALKEVHFVDNEPKAIEALMKEMAERFKHDSNLEINDLVRDRWTPYLRATSVTSSPKSVALSGDMAFKTLEGMEIRLTIGNIAKSTTEVIVNTVASDLNLTKNPCSKAILSEAGEGIKKYCEKWIKDNGQVKDGESATTNGGKLKCKKVLHVSCPTWTADQGEKKLRQLVQKLLDNVQAELKLTSVSIPAIGTGSLKFPEDLVAKVMFEEAMKFSSKHGTSLKIKQYNVVVYSGNTKAVNIFKEQFQVFSNKKIINEPKVPKTTRSKSKTPHVLRKSSAKDKGEKLEDETNGVEVEIIQGNIVEESTDAIGFLVSEDIEQGGQIGQALVARAGDSLRKEYIGLSKIQAGTVVMTSAGNLKARYLLHMVIKDKFLKTDKTMIHNAVKECLNQANDFNFTSLSLPAVGTGHLRKDAKQSAEILYSCIKDYRKRREKTLKLIRIVILQENVFADFKKAFEKKDPTTGTSTDLGVRRTRKQITLTIAAETDNDIAKIKEELRQVEAEQSHSETIEVKQKLDERQQDEILNIEDLHDVRIECEPEIGFIRISGLAKNVLVAIGAIHERIHAWDQERHHMDVTVREVQWFFYKEHDNAVIPEKYPDSISAKIERAYTNNPSGAVEVGEELTYKIDFKSMTETCLDTQETMKVFRRPCDAFPLPSNWENQPIDCSTGEERDVHSFTIDKNDPEYDQIHDMFRASLSKSATTANAEVIKIERIQNPRLYQIYEGQKKTMTDGGNEMKLYHGTARHAVENINKTGFNRAYCGKNAVRFGKGVYFAKQAWYSGLTKYAVPDENGLQYIYIARVLVGKFTKGKEGLIVPPPIDENNQTVAYDSVVDDVEKPLMFVIFYDYQSYPEYLVTFRPN
mgnify:CR=1 FL=1